MGLRLILAMCAAVGGALIGRSLAGACRRRCAVLKDIADGLRALRVNMISMFEPVCESLSRSECAILHDVGEAMRKGSSAREAWQQVKPSARRKGGAIDALIASDEQVLDRLFFHLGESGREQQDILLSGGIRALEERYIEARGKAAETDRLYISLGLLVGLMLALIVV